MDRYDVIVVGAGPGGCAAAYYLARRGYSVLLIEKARVPGQRNVTGGVLYGSFVEGYGLIDLIPEFEREAPLERKVTDYKLVMLTRPSRPGEYRYSAITGKEKSYRVLEIGGSSFLNRLVHGNVSTGHDYAVIRAKFDRWFSRKVEEAGGILVTSTAVEDLVFDGENVVGVRTDKEEVHADLVIDASGVTSALVIKAGLRGPLRPWQVYHGVKMVFQLGEDEINKRFGLRSGEGVAIALLGDFLHDMVGGGFVYTNRDTISVGVVVTMDSMLKALKREPWALGKPVEILEEMISHPYVARLLEGAELVEYSAHNIPKGPRTILEKPLRGGFLAVGDAMGAFTKINAMIDGMRRAIATGIMAAQAYVYAKKRHDFSEKTLAVYLDLLEPIYRDMRRSARSSLISESRLIYGPGYKILLSLAGRKETALAAERGNGVDSVQKIQSLTGLLVYEEDKHYSHIKVDFERASVDPEKLWVPACPANCYTLLVEGKGVFASYKDLYRYNINVLRRRYGKAREREIERKAMEVTWRDVARAELRFDHVPCVSCGTCWAIGPPDVIAFGHERGGHGVKFRYS